MVSWGAPGTADALCFNWRNACHAGPKRKRRSWQCGVQTIEVTPACIAAESIINEPDIVRGPLSSPGRIWLCTSRMSPGNTFHLWRPPIHADGQKARYHSVLALCIIGTALPYISCKGARWQPKPPKACAQWLQTACKRKARPKQHRRRQAAIPIRPPRNDQPATGTRLRFAGQSICL